MIATGETRGLEGVDLFDRDCKVRFIITQQALKEGWDCSFAYVLCSVAEQKSPRAVEQLLGRVLRLPRASRKGHEKLNRAYAFATTASFQHAAMMDSLSTENQGIQPDPLYACGWFQDRVEIHSKTKQAVSMLPWMHHQQRIKEYNRTRCTRVVDRSKIVLRYTPKPIKPSASCHGCTRCLEKRQ